MASSINPNRLSLKHAKILSYARYVYEFLRDTPCIPTNMWDDCFQEAMLVVCENYGKSDRKIKLEICKAIVRCYHAEASAAPCDVPDVASFI